MKKKYNATQIVRLCIALFFVVGSKTVFQACAVKQDGSWMTCHWANQAIFVMACVILFLAILSFIVKDKKVKTGLDLSIIPMCIACMFLPGKIIGLCMMNTMRCHMVMKPFAIVCSLLIMAMSLLDLYQLKEK